MPTFIVSAYAVILKKKNDITTKIFLIIIRPFIFLTAKYFLKKIKDTNLYTCQNDILKKKFKYNFYITK